MTASREPEEARGPDVAAGSPAGGSGPAVLFGFDPDKAARWAARLTRPGPTGTRAELAELVAGLHEAAEFSHPVAVRASRLSPLLRTSGGYRLGAIPRPRVLVVDRAGWCRVAAQYVADMLAVPDVATPVPGDRAADAGPADGRGTQGAGRPGPGGGTGEGAGPGRAAASGTQDATQVTAELAAGLALMAPRVLGQYDPYRDRLVLVAPNLLQMQRGLRDVPARDLYRWVAVHELTHALQFRAAPWLAGHLGAEARALMGVGTDLGSAVSRLVRSLRSEGVSELSLVDAVLDEEDRARVDRVGAVMSVLEGHADVSMDLVGRAVIGSVARLRERLERRRRPSGRLETVLRRLLGLDAKLAQYTEGATFVRAVRKQAGWRALDPVFGSIDAMPTAAEIADPSRWVARLHPPVEEPGSAGEAGPAEEAGSAGDAGTGAGSAEPSGTAADAGPGPGPGRGAGEDEGP